MSDKNAQSPSIKVLHRAENGSRRSLTLTLSRKREREFVKGMGICDAVNYYRIARRVN